MGKNRSMATDQSFLTHIITPLVTEVMLTHDSIELRNIPHTRENYHFVGEVFDGGDNRQEHYCAFLPGSQYEGY